MTGAQVSLIFCWRWRLLTQNFVGFVEACILYNTGVKAALFVVTCSTSSLRSCFMEDHFLLYMQKGTLLHFPASDLLNIQQCTIQEHNYDWRKEIWESHSIYDQYQKFLTFRLLKQGSEVKQPTQPLFLQTQDTKCKIKY